MTIKEAINVDPEILGGAPVFSGTRISIKTLFDYLETSSLEDFLEGHPTVSKEQAEKVIEWSSELMLSAYNAQKSEKNHPQFGSAKGKYQMAEDFDAPLDIS